MQLSTILIYPQLIQINCERNYTLQLPLLLAALTLHPTEKSYIIMDEWDGLVTTQVTHKLLSHGSSDKWSLRAELLDPETLEVEILKNDTLIAYHQVELEPLDIQRPRLDTVTLSLRGNSFSKVSMQFGEWTPCISLNGQHFPQFAVILESGKPTKVEINRFVECELRTEQHQITVAD